MCFLRKIMNQYFASWELHSPVIASAPQNSKNCLLCAVVQVASVKITYAHTKLVHL